MLKKKTPETIPAKLTINSLGEVIELDLVYYNRSWEEYVDRVKAGVTFGELIPWLVKSWETEYTLDVEGLAEMESDRPGMCETLITAWPQARRAALVKN